MKATTDGVVRAPSAFSITFGFFPSMIATHELVVPRSMPIILLIAVVRSLLADGGGRALQEAPRFFSLRPRFDTVKLTGRKRPGCVAFRLDRGKAPLRRRIWEPDAP